MSFVSILFAFSFINRCGTPEGDLVRLRLCERCFSREMQLWAASSIEKTTSICVRKSKKARFTYEPFLDEANDLL